MFHGRGIVRPRLYTPRVRGASPLASAPHSGRSFYAGPPGFCKGKKATGRPCPCRTACAACLSGMHPHFLGFFLGGFLPLPPPGGGPADVCPCVADCPIFRLRSVALEMV